MMKKLLMVAAFLISSTGMAKELCHVSDRAEVLRIDVFHYAEPHPAYGAEYVSTAVGVEQCEFGGMKPTKKDHENSPPFVIVDKTGDVFLVINGLQKAGPRIRVGSISPSELPRTLGAKQFEVAIEPTVALTALVKQRKTPRIECRKDPIFKFIPDCRVYRPYVGNLSVNDGETEVVRHGELRKPWIQ